MSYMKTYGKYLITVARKQSFGIQQVIEDIITSAMI
jgi:hypothetical protein